ncbi:MAG: hypothetical protein L0322_11245 [Chloroflexi bacterium]|nr:hypothetical protein [Chloroflexota bacterium]
MDENNVGLVVSYALIGFWLPAYVLVIWHGFKEKTYGMPIVAMCGNWPWEIMLGAGMVRACPIAWEACPQPLIQGLNAGAAVLDAFIVYTIFKFGRDKFSDSLMRRYYYPILIFGLVSSAAIQYTATVELGFPNIFDLAIGGQTPDYLPLQDQGGPLTAFGLTLLAGVLFITMLRQRDSLEGQSFYIALFMLLGNFFAYLFLFLLGEIIGVITVLYVGTLLLNFIYVAMVYRKCRALGINPWLNF